MHLIDFLTQKHSFLLLLNMPTRQGVDDMYVVNKWKTIQQCNKGILISNTVWESSTFFVFYANALFVGTY